MAGGRPGHRLAAYPTPLDGSKGMCPMSAESNKALVRQFIEEAQSQHDLTAVDRFMAPDFVDHSAPAGLPPTAEGVKMQFGMFFGAIPDMRAVIHAQVADDDTVVTRKTLSGTHQGALF